MRDFLAIPKGTPKKYLTKLERRVFERDGYRCHYCGSPHTLTLDHVLPKTKGGTHDEQNLVAACRTCNVSKGSRDYETFKESVSVDLICFAVTGMAEW